MSLQLLALKTMSSTKKPSECTASKSYDDRKLNGTKYVEEGMKQPIEHIPEKGCVTTINSRNL